jgi:hypothetical protein
MKSRSKLIGSLVQWLEQNWRILLDLLGALAIIGVVVDSFSLRVGIKQLQAELSQQQYERSLLPELQYFYQLTISRSDVSELEEAAVHHVEEFYAQLYEYTQANPGITYREAIKAVAPFTATVPARPVEIIATIQNVSTNRAATATDVRLFLAMDRRITELSVHSREPFTILEGGTGETSMILEVDRIVAGETITVEITSETTESTAQQDHIVIHQGLGSSSGRSSSSSSSRSSRSTSRSTLWVFDLEQAVGLPDISYLPGKNPQIAIDVTANEGEATLLGFGSSTPF